VAAAIEADIEELAAAAPDLDQPIGYFFELSEDLHTVTSDTFIGELLGTIGLASIADSVDPAAGGYPQLSNEYILDADPAIVFLAHTDGTTPPLEAIEARPGWADLEAVQQGHVVALDTDIASRWGPRIVDLLRAVVDTVQDLSG
jgi:iron complex transport system substrate-binding protein